MMEAALFNTRDALVPFRLKSALTIAVAAFVMLAGAALPARAKEDLKELDKISRKQYRLSQSLYRKGKIAESAEMVRDILGRYPAHATSRLRLAYLMLKLKRYDEAYDISFDVALKNQKNADAFAVLGATLLSAGRFADSARLLNASLDIDEEQPLAWFGIGMLNFYENRIPQSIDALERAAYYDAFEPDFIFALAQVRARGERYREAATAYETFLNVSPETDKDRRDRIKGLINFLRYLGGKFNLYTVGGQDKTSVGVELLRDRPVIRVRVNRNEEPLRFVLDTGSGISVISRETAERLKIKPVTQGGMARAIGGNGKFPIVYGFLERVRIGEAEISNVPVYIREFQVNDEKIDGYIGLSLISKFMTTIDYGDPSFTLVRKDSDAARAMDLSQARSLPLRLTSSGFLSGEVQLEGMENALNFIVDTGASISVISQTVAKTDGISRYIREERMRVVGAAGVTEDVESFLLPRVSFGENSLEKITAVALNLDLINEASGFQQAGILGGNFLKNYRLTFDFKNSKVFFTPVK